jgi:hypothetical protein
MDNKTLVNLVIEQMKRDIEVQDWTAIAELLEHIPEENLTAFLPE